MVDDVLNTSVIAVVGGENPYNMKLVNTLTRFLHPDQVYRPLTLRQMYDFAAQHADSLSVVLLDLLDFDLYKATQMVGKIRSEYPNTVFMLWIDKAEFEQAQRALPPEWAIRFEHYFKLYKAADDTEFEPILRRRILVAVRQAKSKHQPAKTHVTAAELPKQPSADKIFISYAHADWLDFVSGLTKQLSSSGFGVWVDQHLLVGGDDWVDSIAQALEECKVLVLVLTPESLASRYVKMEYRYFFNYDKPIIPLLYKPIKNVPVELMSTQYIDFQKATDQAYAQLFQAIKQYIPTW